MSVSLTTRGVGHYDFHRLANRTYFHFRIIITEIFVRITKKKTVMADISAEKAALSAIPQKLRECWGIPIMIKVNLSTFSRSAVEISSRIYDNTIFFSSLFTLCLEPLPQIALFASTAWTNAITTWSHNNPKKVELPHLEFPSVELYVIQPAFRPQSPAPLTQG